VKLGYLAVGFFSMAICGCGDNKEGNEVVPPGFCKTETECQPEADRENAQEAKLREERASQGVHEQYLPCGTYKPTKAPNGYWSVTHDSAGCPSTASQQDPHPVQSKAKNLNH
jgi:hypothetical protein